MGFSAGRSAVFVAVVMGSALAGGACGAAADSETAEAIAVAVDGGGEPRFDQSMVWTGEEVLIVGGAGGDMTDGLLVDRALRWSSGGGLMPMTAMPGPVTARASAVWTGDEMLIWSGSTRPFGVAGGMVHSAAAYDPDADSWRQLSAAPLELGRVYGQGTVVGSTAIFVGGWPGRSEDTHRVALYDIATDTWSETFSGPKPIDVVAVDDIAYVLNIDSDGHQVWRFDPASGSSEALPRANVTNELVGGALVTDGTRLYLWLEGPETSAGLFVHTPSAAAGWTPVEIGDGPLSRSGLEEYRVTPAAMVDGWIVINDNEGLRWIDPDTGRDVRHTLTSRQACALGPDLVPVDDGLFAWNGRLCEIDGEQVIGGFLFSPPAELTSEK